MDLLDKNELTGLLDSEAGVHVSMFLPLEREPDKRDMNRIRLKNLIKEGKERLAKEDFLPPEMDRPDVEQFFDAAESLLGGLPVEVEQGRGLAIFLGPETERVYHLPIEIDEAVMIGPRFHIKPLLPLLTENGRFYLLTLSQQKVQLWRGSRFNLEPVEAAELPAGQKEALALEDPERVLQFHTSTSTDQTGTRPAVHHGSEVDREKKGAILRYFREVDEAVVEGLAGLEAPLLVAAVDYLLPIYQEANTYGNLLEEGVTGNPDHLNEKELHEQAWTVAEPYFEQVKQEDLALYREVANTENSGRTVEEIVPAAAYGRVKSLFVPVENGRPKWGRFNQSSGEVERCEEATYRCGDLLNLAAIETLQNGGTVYAIDAEEMPDEEELAAIYRYAV